MSEADAHGTGSGGTTLERDREEFLNAARPLPPDEEVLIGDLTEEEDRLFLEAIMSASVQTGQTDRAGYHTAR